MAGAIFPKSRGGVRGGRYGRWNVLGNTIGYPQKSKHLPKIAFLGREMIELRSPDLWGVPFDAEFHARFAHEGPKDARAQFKR